MTGVNHTSAGTAVPLLPCPFCGCDKIEIFYDDPSAVGGMLAGYYIHHPLWKKHPETWECWQNFGGKFETREAAAEAWNTRSVDPAQQPGMREALERALWELTDLARPICSVFNRSTKKYEFDDEHVAKALPSTFAVIQQIRTALAAQPPAAPVEQVCPGGIDPGFDECPKCGATDEEECRGAPRSSAGSAPVVWRVRYCGQWMYFEEKANAEIYAQGDDNTEPLYRAAPQEARMRDAVEEIRTIAEGDLSASTSAILAIRHVLATSLSRPHGATPSAPDASALVQRPRE